MGWCPMKAFTLDSQQRKDIEKRRRQASDKRIFSRLSALLWLAEGMTQQQVASRLGVSSRQVNKWVRLFRGSTLDAFSTLNYRGDPGNLRPPQLERLKAEIQKGRFHTARQVRDWIAQTFHRSYSESGIKDLLHRIGASFHQVSGFFWKADRQKQKAFVRNYRRQKRRAGPETRRYFVDACHPVWGMELLYSCWLLVGQRFLVGVGNGRKRLNILGAYCPDDQEYLDLRLTRGNINGEQFVNLLRLLRETHPETKEFLLYLDNARYYDKPVVQDWLKRHPEFRLVKLPAYSPNLNLIERLWKFLRKEALSCWHKTFVAMQAAVSRVLDHLEDYREELSSLMTETFSILKEADVPVEESVAG
jgi:transposase